MKIQNTIRHENGIPKRPTPYAKIHTHTARVPNKTSTITRTTTSIC